MKLFWLFLSVHNLIILPVLTSSCREENYKCDIKVCEEEEKDLPCAPYDRRNKNSCTCCQICKPTLNENCGGILNFYGECRRGFKCVEVYKYIYDEITNQKIKISTDIGKCKPKNFQEENIVLEDHGLTDLNPRPCADPNPSLFHDDVCMKYTCNTITGKWIDSKISCPKTPRKCQLENKGYMVKPGECCGICVENRPRKPISGGINYNVITDHNTGPHYGIEDHKLGKVDHIPNLSNHNCKEEDKQQIINPCMTQVCILNQYNQWNWQAMIKTKCEVSEHDCSLKNLFYYKKPGECCGNCVGRIPDYTINDHFSAEKGGRNQGNDKSGSVSSEDTNELLKMLLRLILILRPSRP